MNIDETSHCCNGVVDTFGLYVLAYTIDCKNIYALAYFAEIFNTALTAQSAQKQQTYKIHLSFYSAWDT